MIYLGLAVCLLSSVVAYPPLPRSAVFVISEILAVLLLIVALGVGGRIYGHFINANDREVILPAPPR